MIGDSNLYFADEQAYSSGTSSEVDLGELPGNTPGLEMWFDGDGLAAAGDITISLQTSSTSGSGHAEIAKFTYSPAELNAGVKIPINPMLLLRYNQLVLGGSPSAGTWTAFVVDGPQTAQ